MCNCFLQPVQVLSIKCSLLLLNGLGKYIRVLLFIISFFIFNCEQVAIGWFCGHIYSSRLRSVPAQTSSNSFTAGLCSSHSEHTPSFQFLSYLRKIALQHSLNFTISPKIYSLIFHLLSPEDPLVTFSV